MLFCRRRQIELCRYQFMPSFRNRPLSSTDPAFGQNPNEEEDELRLTARAKHAQPAIAGIGSGRDEAYIYYISAITMPRIERFRTAVCRLQGSDLGEIHRECICMVSGGSIRSMSADERSLQNAVV
jgi:hypothetical protein